VPNEKGLQQQVLQAFHNTPIAGHFGRERTYHAMRPYLYWKGMYNDVADYCSTCQACIWAKPLRQQTPGRLNPLPIPSRPWLDIAFDFITDLPPSTAQFDSTTEEGQKPLYDAILVVVDRFSKMGHYIQCKKNIDSWTFAMLFLNKIFKHHKLPTSIVSDQGMLFTALFWETIVNSLGIHCKLSTAFHMQTNGQTERLNAMLEQFLCIYTDHQQLDWSDWLYLAEYAYNNSQHAATKLTPFEICGIPPREILIRTGTNTSSKATVLTESFQEIYDKVRENLTSAQESQALYYNAKHKNIEFKPGDKVWLLTRNIKTERPCKKLGPKRIGPFLVLKRIRTQSYVLKCFIFWPILYDH
jgi:hypothetical protein